MLKDEIEYGMHVLVRVWIDEKNSLHLLPPSDVDSNEGALPFSFILLECYVVDVDEERDADIQCIAVKLTEWEGDENQLWVRPSDLVLAPDALCYTIPGSHLVRHLANGNVLEREDKRVTYRIKDAALCMRLCDRDYTNANITPYDLWYNYRILNEDEVKAL